MPVESSQSARCSEWNVKRAVITTFAKSVWAFRDMPSFGPLPVKAELALVQLESVYRRSIPSCLLSTGYLGKRDVQLQTGWEESERLCVRLLRAVG